MQALGHEFIEKHLNLFKEYINEKYFNEDQRPRFMSSQTNQPFCILTIFVFLN